MASPTTQPQNRAAWLMTKQAPKLEVADSPMPTRADNQLTIRTRAVAFNPVDAKMQGGFIIDTFPAILGCDAAGEVVAVGSEAAAQGFRVGDRVAGCCDQIGDRRGKGVYQLYSNLQVGMVGKIPDGVEFKDACVLPITMLTAVVGLCYEGCLGLPMPGLELPAKASGKTVLIWGGASSVGSSAIMIAKAAGLKVAAVAGAKNAEYVRSLGADFAFDYRSETVVEDVAGALKGQGGFGGAFATVMDQEAYNNCAKVCMALGGKQMVATVVPEYLGIKEKLPGDVEIGYNSGPWLPNNRFGPALFKEWFTPALEKGVLQCKPPAKVVGKGLEEIQKGLDAIAAGASANKFVVELP